MGNSSSVDAAARVHIFASSNSWIEDTAIRQLHQLAERNGIVAVAGLPDIHPGHHGPVGAAALADGVVHADVIGTDIGCGMQFWSLDVAARKLNIDRLVQRFSVLEGPWIGDGASALEKRGIDAGDFASSIGTIGGGNHFCELQVVEKLTDEDAARQHNIVVGSAALLVHSGSRGFGAHVLRQHYSSGTTGIPLQDASDYLKAHDAAVAYARLNREVIAARAMTAIRTDGMLVTDQPHNLVEVNGTSVLHRKGAAPSDRGLVPIAGSRGTFSYLVEPLAGPAQALASLSHGAGRKHDRGSMERRIRTAPGKLQALTRTRLGSRVICTDRRLLMEEAPEAYKDISNVIADLEAAKLIRVVAVLRPLITFKTARETREDVRRARS